MPQELLVNHIYLKSILILLVFVIISKLLILFSEHILLRLAKKTQTSLDDLIIKHTDRPISLLLIVVGLRLSIVDLPITQPWESIVIKSIYFLIVFISIYITHIVVTIFIDHWGEQWAKRTKSAVDEQVIKLLHRASTVLFFLIGVMIILDLWGIEIGPLLASLGIAGIAVAFAMQNTLGNIFGGISMIMDRSIKVGDVVELDGKISGKVLDVGMRSTKIQTWNNEVVIIPNGKLSEATIQNNALPDLSARTMLDFSVAYGSDPEKVKKIVLQEIKKIQGLDETQENMVRFRSLGESGLNFRVYIWMQSYNERFRAIDEANTLIYKALRKQGIGIPFPQLDVHLKKK
ncbi:mechanosensitive ion channel family protein [Candidatus Woesearchaeota archaeon]|nr:mechanosensitive ion channel family protein [Candidatus Woesearchaeota archaeon]